VLQNQEYAIRELGISDRVSFGGRLESVGQREERISLKTAGKLAAQQAEKQLIMKTLLQTRWNRKKAAEILEISYKALLYKIKQNGLSRKK
jgi:DNA-binding NtrC family response regulator